MKTVSNLATVLIADCRPEVLEPLTGLLENEGYKIITASDGHHALELASTLEPDIIISHIMPHGIDVAEFCRLLKADARMAYVPLMIVSSAQGAQQSIPDELHACADEHLEIPFRHEELLVKVARLTERHRVERQYRALIEESTEIIYTRDMLGRIESMNEAGARFFGRSVNELIGASLQELLGPEAAAREIAETNEETPEETLRSICQVDDARGVSRHLELTSMLLRDAEGRPRGVRSVMRDITERRQADQALAQQVEREALINRISGAVRRSLDLAEVFRTAVQELGMHLCVDRCSLLMKYEKAGVVRNVAEYNAPGVQLVRRDFPISQFADLDAEIRRHGVLAFDDAASDERISDLYTHVLRPAGTRSIMYVAIQVGEEMPAAFALSTTRGLRHWREADIALARAVADQTGIAIRQAQLYQKAEATSSREALINRLSLAVRASLSLPEVLSTATRELGRALAASRVHLRLYDPALPESLVEHEYVAPNVASIKSVIVSYDDPVGQRLLRASQPIVIDDALNCSSGSREFNEHVRSHAELYGVRSQINYPLVLNGRFRGALCIHQTDRLRHWTEDELALVESVAAQLAIGIAQAELFEVAQRAKKEWETTFNAMSDGIFIFDNAGQLIRVNRAGAAMEDTWPHLLLGRRCCDILRAGGNDEVCIVEKTIADGRSVTVEITPERYNRPLLVTAEPIFEGGTKTVGAVCTARDLSELRKAEAVARERQWLLTNILESVREPICALDTKGRFMWVNSATISSSGYSQEDLIGHHYLELVYPADHELARENVEAALHGETRSYEVRYLLPDGEVRYALLDNAPLVIDGRTTGVLCISRDITEHKQERQRAAQADKLRALGQLASGVAHDFNNALAAILGRAQLMRRQIHTEAITSNLDIIQTAAEDAAATVRRIQTFARQSQDKEFEALDVSRLLRDAVEITRTRWENEARMLGLNYEVEINAECPLYTSGNASELREVFVNLIVNAVDAMPQGGRLSINCERQEERVRLRFTDTGMGMTEDVREKIFEPFYTTKGANGTGLGLAVSYGIIERHAGSIAVESEIGKGTTFEIDLPVADCMRAHAVEPQAQRQTPSLSILVVDDEPFVRETLADMLVALNHRVVAAESGRAALETLAAGHFDLVFTDLSMPEMDGWETAREIRRRWPETCVVVVTGHGKNAAPPPRDRDLISDIIGKPFDFDEVTETIAKAIGYGMGVREWGPAKKFSDP
ncbi:MAG TPA: PAS domain S-box protein [Pyrinomonadaceae bacterium]|nr:PAS domain S-box protein [Pyrinomonadaceae bacterium]